MITLDVGGTAGKISTAFCGTTMYANSGLAHMGRRTHVVIFQAVSDDPCCLFTDQLVAAYPEAKIILTTRTNASIWLSSMEGFILKILQWRYAYYLLGFFDRESTKPSIELLQCTTSVLSGGRCPTSHAGKMAMLDYYEQQISHVKMAASKSNRPFLEFRPEIGWKPLCDFLGLPVPMVKYPHMNTSYDAMKGERREDRGRWKVVAYRMVVPVILTVVISMYTWSQYC